MKLLGSQVDVRPPGSARQADASRRIRGEHPVPHRVIEDARQHRIDTDDSRSTQSLWTTVRQPMPAPRCAECRQPSPHASAAPHRRATRFRRTGTRWASCAPVSVHVRAIAQVVDRSRPTRRSDRRSVVGAGARRRPRRCGGPVTRPVRSRGRRGRCPSPDDDRPARCRQNNAGPTPSGAAAAVVGSRIAGGDGDLPGLIYREVVGGPCGWSC